jgi:hypothetical protein
MKRASLLLPSFLCLSTALQAQRRPCGWGTAWGWRSAPVAPSAPSEVSRFLDLHAGSGWNATAEVDTLFNDRWGISAKAGTKSDGFFPGLPVQDGAYFAFGVRGVW